MSRTEPTIAVTHRIAGITFRTESNVRLPRLHGAWFEPFRVTDTEPDVRQTIYKVYPDASTTPQVADGQGGYLLCSPMVQAKLGACQGRSEQIEIGLYRNQAIFRNFSQRTLDYFYTGELWGYDHERRVSNADFRVAANLRQICSAFMPCFSALLIHGCGVVRDGRALLFLAPSGGGKTTVIGLSSGDPVLSDDQIVLRRQDDIVSAHGTPLGSVIGGPHSAALGGLILLEKSDHFELQPVKPAELLEYSWAAQPAYTFFLPQDLRRAAFHILYDACHQAPVYRMHFSRDFVDWQAIDAAVAG